MRPCKRVFLPAGSSDNRAAEIPATTQPGVYCLLTSDFTKQGRCQPRTSKVCPSARDWLRFLSSTGLRVSDSATRAQSNEEQFFTNRKRILGHGMGPFRDLL